MKESDWKVFTELKDRAIEKYCTFVLGESQEVFLDQKNHVHNHYLLLYKLLQNRNKQKAILFDGYIRLKAWIQLMLIRREGLIDEVLLAKLPDKLRHEKNPEKLGW